MSVSTPTSRPIPPRAARIVAAALPHRGAGAAVSRWGAGPRLPHPARLAGCCLPAFPSFQPPFSQLPALSWGFLSPRVCMCAGGLATSQECAEVPLLRAERPLLAGEGGEAGRGAALGRRSRFLLLPRLEACPQEPVQGHVGAPAVTRGRAGRGALQRPRLQLRSLLEPAATAPRVAGCRC